MFAEERKQQILAALQRDPAVRVTDLGRALRVSVASIRRDLADLERSGLLKRTHGGAVSNRLALAEPSLAEKKDRHQAEKEAIAAVAAALVQPGDTIFLDSGSTTRAIAMELRHRRGVTVVTNALNIGWDLASSDLELVITGGQLRPGVLSQVGPVAEQAIAALHVDKLFLAANGIDLAAGVTTPNLAEAQTKRAMIASARQVILVADHSKFGQATFGSVCGLERLHAIITDAGLSSEVLAAYEQRGVTMHVAALPRAARSSSPRAGQK
jgi:DeoR family transcriptional regulator, fructose operon transcriptional repressor